MLNGIMLSNWMNDYDLFYTFSLFSRSITEHTHTQFRAGYVTLFSSNVNFGYFRCQRIGTNNGGCWMVEMGNGWASIESPIGTKTIFLFIPIFIQYALLFVWLPLPSCCSVLLCWCHISPTMRYILIVSRCVSKEQHYVEQSENH